MLCGSSSNKDLYTITLKSSESDRTIRPAHSISNFSCTEQEMEYDLYDCDINNVMATPGSMFAQAYWDGNTISTMDLELLPLFSGNTPEEAENMRLEKKEIEQNFDNVVNVSSKCKI